MGGNAEHLRPAATLQVVRVVWAGGITRPDNGEPGDAERMLYQVRLRQPDGAVLNGAPFALGDLGDGDNNHLLCLDVPGTPLEVAFPAGYFTDPNDDLNPDTRVAVTQ
ncbi:MAG: hypothetical protein HC822_15670 [Oscillochloris sp.]|nr:hypothetical protein [Oscillochloris sp.]